MKKILTIGILMAIASMSYASENTKSAQPSKDKEYGKLSYSIGLEQYQETYKEYDTSAGNATFMKEKANMTGLLGRVSYQVTLLDQFSLKGRYALGKSDYTGAYQNGTYGSLISDDQDRSVWEIGVEYRHKFIEMKDIHVGVGINYRELNDRLDQAGAGGYKRVNGIWYAGLSADKDFIVNNWTITPKATLKVLLDGTQKSYVDPSLTITHSQRSGNGYDLEVAFAKKFHNYNFVLSPYYKSMSIGDSNKVYLSDGTDIYETMEPKNKTTEAGLKIGLQF
jgi:hypothetical protein